MNKAAAPRLVARLLSGVHECIDVMFAGVGRNAVATMHVQVFAGAYRLS